MIRTAALVLAFSGAGLQPATQAQGPPGPQVLLRGGEASPAGQIVAIDAGGVWLGAPSAAEKPAEPERPGAKPAPVKAAEAPVLAISWDRIRSVAGGGAQAEQAAPYLTAAEQAWRARTRPERADLLAAEPLFETLYNQKYRNLSGPTAAVIAEGLLRCRLHRGAHVKAVGPWLTLVRASGPQPA